MKRIFLLLSILTPLLFASSSCWKIDEGSSVVLKPIEISAASDTINADLGIELKYGGLSVKSDLQMSRK